MLSLLIAIGFCSTDPTLVNGVLRDSFESTSPIWFEEGGNVTRKIRSHARTRDYAQTGNYCEHIGITAGNGTYLLYSYAVGRVPILEETVVRLSLQSDRPNLQIMARVVFPDEVDPDTGEILTTLITGDMYSSVGKWQQLTIPEPEQALDRQLRLLRRRLDRSIEYKNAFIDRVVVNVYGGLGTTDVYLDDLEISPVFSRETGLPSVRLRPLQEVRSPEVSISQDQLLVNDRQYLLRAIHAPGVDPTRLREYGFNAATVSWPINPSRIESLVRADLWLLPQLPEWSDPRHVEQLVDGFPLRESVLSWHLGTGFKGSDFEKVVSAIDSIRKASPARPVGAEIEGNVRAFGRELDLIQVQKNPLGTSLSIYGWMEWLADWRRKRPGTFYFTWIPSESRMVQTAAGPVDAGPMPEQLHVMALSAVGAGYPAFGYWADNSLGTTSLGKQRLLQMGLTHLQLGLMTPYLVSAGSVSSVPAYVERDYEAQHFQVRRQIPKQSKKRKKNSREPKPANIKVTMIRSTIGIVVIPTWHDGQMQRVAGQMALRNVTITIPGIPQYSKAWLVSPVEKRFLSDREHVTDGTKFHLAEFDTSSIILIPFDHQELNQLGEVIKKTGPWASRWAHELAREKLGFVEPISRELRELGSRPEYADNLVLQAREHIANSYAMLQRGDHAQAYRSALQSLQACRTLQRAHWDLAVKQAGAPETSPYLNSFATLPEHFRFMRQVLTAGRSANLASHGDFEVESTTPLFSAGWKVDDGGTEADPSPGQFGGRVIPLATERGTKVLHLRSVPRNSETQPVFGVHNSPSINSPRISIREGELFRIQYRVKIPGVIRNGAGVLIFDSLSGINPIVSLKRTKEWKEITMYRRANTNGELQVRIQVIGTGDVFIDDLEINRLTPVAPMTNLPAPNTRR